MLFDQDAFEASKLVAPASCAVLSTFVLSAVLRVYMLNPTSMKLRSKS